MGTKRGVEGREEEKKPKNFSVPLVYSYSFPSFSVVFPIQKQSYLNWPLVAARGWLDQKNRG